MARYTVFALTSLMLPVIAAAAPTPRVIGKPAEIPFVRYNGIYDFRADGDNAIYLQDDRHNWYHATFMGPCVDLPFATRIAVKTRDTSSLDRFGEIIVGDDECQIEELVTSDPPPEKVKKAKHKG